MGRHDLVDRFRLDNPDREMGTWLDISLTVQNVRRADTDFVTFPTFDYVV